ncbi:unnamed protein product [Phytophthora lilii]|uniref:Unnamed protein product n=1 Tax=Phytophthora lilii TaxID=2077276 RepID=A0A9W6TQA5_9STRA|nr:unnamed protein product [Phytophthora lilii]
MLATAASFPVRNGKGYGDVTCSGQRGFNGRDRIGSIHGIASPNIHASVRAAALAARQARQFRQKRTPALFTVQDDEVYGASLNDQTQIRVPSPVAPSQNKRKMNLHLSLDKLEKPVLPMMMVLHEEPKTDCGPRRKSVLFADDPVVDDLLLSVEPGFAVFAAQSAPGYSSRPRRASSVTLSMNSPEAAEFKEVAHDGTEELGKRTKRVKKLGKGAGGTVFLSLYLPTLKLVAVKEVVVYQEEDRHMVKRELHALHDNLAPIDADAPQHEIGGPISSDTLKSHFLATLRSRNALCPYLVTFYGAFLKPAKCAVSVVMEFMDMGSVQDLLDANITMSEDVLRHAAFCCTQFSVIDSYLVAEQRKLTIIRCCIFLKVADFGLAGTLAKSNSFFSDFTGTMMYMAPERISGAQYTCVSDVWSLGITLFSLATGAYPFTVDDGFFGLEEAICQDTLPPMPNRFSPVCRDFIRRMLNRDPERRLTSDQALTHPFISGYTNSAAFQKFPQTWRSLKLKRAIDPEDTRTIASIAVEYFYRYPGIVTLPPEVTGEPAAEIPPSSSDKHSLLQCFTKLLGHTPNTSEVSSRTPFQKLADDCGVSTEYLLKLFREVRC